MIVPRIQKVLSIYDEQQRRKLQDFLLSEMDLDTVQETIEFVTSSDNVKEENFKELLYTGNDYEGFLIEGNQYLISSAENKVVVIDQVGEEHGIDEKYTRYSISIDDFIFLVSEREEVIKWIRSNIAKS